MVTLTFVEHLASMGALPAPERKHARAPQNYRALLEQSGLDSLVFAQEVAKFHGLPRADFDELQAGSPLTVKFSPRFLRDWAIYPYESKSKELRLAVADLSDSSVLRMIELTLGQVPVREVASFEEIDSLLRGQDTGGGSAAADADGFSQGDVRSADIDDLDSLRDLASGAVVVRALAQLFERAVEMRATDIHIEPFRRALHVRMRVDGLLRPIPAPSAELSRAIVSRVKILAGLNIAERRLPQDGRARIRVGNAEVDLRVATMPTAHGEGAILRLLERNKRLLNLGRLGLPTASESLLRQNLETPHGLIIVTGPTGSGKTTTLAAAMALLNTPVRKILSIEDPIEYDIPGVNQSQVKPAIGLTFATALRSFLRQDPDVIMVGEMRDGETAKIGVQASLTGHLVLTTLHTNTAAAALSRLTDMGVEPFLLASTLNCILGQRLVRVLCPDCRTMGALGTAELAKNPRFEAIGLKAGDKVGVPVGCERCLNTGYRGRQGVFELLEVTPAVRRLVSRRADDAEIEAQARSEGMVTMIEDGLEKCRAGTTSVEELLRVVASR